MTERSKKSGPLSGIRVLDLSRLVAGNMLTLQLADFGAEVIKIEEPRRGDTLRHWLDDGVPLHWKVYSRNKKSVALDIRTPDGRDCLLRLAEGAQVFVESNRPGVLERLGIGPDLLWSRNPGLIVVRLSGWGQTGPYSGRPGFGSLVEAMSGFAAKNGFADKPPALPNLALADMVAGLYGAYATMVALREVESKGGQGQIIDLSLLEPLFSFLAADVAVFQATGRIPPRSGNRASITAPRNVYLTSDGQWFALSASTQDMAERLFKAMGHAELISDPRFRTNSDRLQHVEEVDNLVQGFIGKMSLEQTAQVFEQNQITGAPVYDPSQFVRDPHVRDREVIVDVDDPEVGRVTMHNVVPRLGRTPGSIRTPAPALGQHTEEVLRAAGFNEAQIQRASSVARDE